MKESFAPRDSLSRLACLLSTLVFLFLSYFLVSLAGYEKLFLQLVIPARGIIDLEGNLGIGKVGIFGNERSNWHNDEDGRKIRS